MKPTERNSSTLVKEDLEILKSAFPKERLGIKIQAVSREKTRAMLVLYLQHTDVQNRLEEVDPAWTCEVVSEEKLGDSVFVRSKLTVKGVTRENVGEGSEPKGAYSDALKRCAMLFGIGRYLYDSPTVWAEYDESKDRFKHWNYEDYEKALNSKRERGVPVTQAALSQTRVRPIQKAINLQAS